MYRICAGLLGIVALCVVSCTPVRQPYTAHDTSPLLKSERVVTGDGTELPLNAYPVKNPKAMILAVHGFNDYSEAFRLFATEANKHRISVYAYDQRGFGRNVPQGIWAGSDNLARDFCDVLHVMQQKHARVPLIVLSESMGGAVVVHAAATCVKNQPDAYIFSAPAIWGGDLMNPIYRVILWGLAHITPSKEFTGEGLQIRATDNIEILREMSRDANVIKSTRADSIYGLQQLMDDAHQDVKQDIFGNIPVLMLYGKHDEVVPYEVMQYTSEHISDADLYLFEQGYHMLLRDRERNQVYQTIFEWMDSHAKSR